MDELTWLRVLGGALGGGFGSGVDLAAVLAFIAFGVVAFLAPVVGYQGGRSAGITASLFLLSGYVAVSVLQLLVQWVQLLDTPTRGGPGGRGLSGLHLLIAFTVLKMLLFLAAMLSFAIGVRTLSVRRPSPAAPEAAADRGREDDWYRPSSGRGPGG
jgi:hypothetical protein